jgi:type VI secretion system protein ImpH
MAMEPGPTADAVSWRRALAARPGRFDFHVVLRLFEVSARDAPRLGEAQHPSLEPLRLGQAPSPAFNGAPLLRFDEPDTAGPPRLSVGFFGLWGPQGPVPGHMTEYANERARHASDRTLTRFADIFHHRLLLLFHRAWTRSRPTAAFDRPGTDAFARYVGALMGVGQRKARPDAAPPDAAGPDFARLYYAPIFAAPSRSADGLRALVAELLEAPVQVEEFVREAVELPQEERWRLGDVGETATLGRTVLGARVWSCTHRVRIGVGPLDRQAFESLRPGSQRFETLARMVRLYTNDEWQWELRLRVTAGAVSPLRLGAGARLGWSACLGRSSARPADLLVDAGSRTPRWVPAAPE